MTTVGDRPERGVRFTLARERAATPPWNYRGQARTPEEAFEVSAVVTASGAVTVAGAAAAPILEKMRLVLRTLYRQAQEDVSASEGPRPPPSRVVRWRDV